MPQDRLRSPRGSHGRRLTSLNHLEFRVWDQYQLSADDFGVMRCSSITVQADNDALADCQSEEVQAALERLIAVNLVAVFEHQERRYICQLDWQSFQKVEYPRATALPKPPESVLSRCDSPTRRLFAKHPGGWKKKGRRSGGTMSDGSPEGPPEGVPEGSPKVSGTTPGTPPDGSPEGPPEDFPRISHKPLAVCRLPLAVSDSREPLDLPAAIARVLEAFRDQWQRTYHQACGLMTKPLEDMQLGQQIQAHSEAQILLALTGYFSTADPYVIKARHPLPMFLRHPFKYLAKDPIAPAPRPRNCKHDPPCADDAAHTKRDMSERRAS